jgi:hypothetical protein
MAEGCEVVERRLREIAGGGPIPAGLRVTYSDLHGFHGGLEMVVSGDGKVVQEAVRCEARPPKDLDEAGLRRLARVLVEQAAWEQRVADEMPVPDESRAFVKVEVEGGMSYAWERYNDMERLKRLAVVRDEMQRLAWR